MSTVTRAYTGASMGVLRLLDWQGNVMDSAPYFGRGPVRFGAAPRYFTCTAIRLDQPDGTSVIKMLDSPMEVQKGWLPTIRA